MKKITAMPLIITLLGFLIGHTVAAMERDTFPYQTEEKILPCAGSETSINSTDTRPIESTCSTYETQEALRSFVNKLNYHKNYARENVQKAETGNDPSLLFDILEGYFLPRLKQISEPTERETLTECITYINTALNRMQFFKNNVQLERKKIPPLGNPFKKTAEQTSQAFICLIQHRVENAKEEASKTKTEAPLNHLITSLAELMLDADTGASEQEILNEYIDQLTDELRTIHTQQSHGVLPTATASFAEKKVPVSAFGTATSSAQPLHVYRLPRHKRKKPKYILPPLYSKTTPQEDSASSSYVSYCHTSTIPDASDIKSTQASPSGKFYDILQAVALEYKDTRTFVFLDTMLATYAAENKSASPEAVTLMYLKKNPAYLLTDPITMHV